VPPDVYGLVVPPDVYGLDVPEVVVLDVDDVPPPASCCWSSWFELIRVVVVVVVVVVVLVVPVAEPAPEYGVGHCAASVFHFSGESPLVIEQLWLMLLCMLIDVIADAVQATCPSTGRLATVINTGVAASPPRSNLRRLPDCRLGVSIGVSGVFITKS
jgi:hypothetical protein